MDRPRANRKPSFRAQATLIVLPVVILASVGAWSLRQDRLLAEQEARDRARQLAEMVLPELAEALARLHTNAVTSAEAQARTRLETPAVVSFRVSSDGQKQQRLSLRDIHPSPAPDPEQNSPEITRNIPRGDLGLNRRATHFVVSQRTDPLSSGIDQSSHFRLFTCIGPGVGGLLHWAV